MSLYATRSRFRARSHAKLATNILSSSMATDSGDDSTNNHQAYQKSYTLNGIGKGPKVTITTDTGHILTTDLPTKMGGSNSAPQPVETLLAAWMGCTQATALFVGRHMTVTSSPDGQPRRLALQKLEFENIRAYRDERGALALPISENPGVESRIGRITGTIRVFARDEGGVSVEQMELLKEQTEVRCPVANMIIASGCSMDVEWVDASEK